MKYQEREEEGSQTCGGRTRVRERDMKYQEREEEGSQTYGGRTRVRERET